MFDHETELKLKWDYPVEKSPTRSDCDIEMDVGFVPDHFVYITQSHWHPGSATEKTFLGALKLDRKLMIPITAFRCPDCRQLKLYANRKP